MTQYFTGRLSTHLKASQLTFSCYRIRRKWSLQLPVVALPELDVQIRGFAAQSYPWHVWCLWALEERIHTLAGAAHFAGNQAALARCVEDLEALAQWPRYTVAGNLGLPYGHAVQLMATALLQWPWLPEAPRYLLRQALHRAIDEALPLLMPLPAPLLTTPNPHQHLHNIPLIAQAALATAAEAVGHPEREVLSARFRHQLQARLALFHKGLTEGISYDGYLYNFALAWLKTQPAEAVQAVVHHTAILDLENQALGLACPGNVALSAEIGDVEPVDMPFVWSALARLQHFTYSASRASLLAAVPPERLRAEALWALAESAGVKIEAPPLALPAPAAIQQSTFALTLAMGLEHDDLSCVMALCRSPMNHVQADNGTLLIGHTGHWWITDPGYQQYLKTSEREFTLGPAARNTPVINGHGHVHKEGRLLYTGELEPAGHGSNAYAVVDLTACYPAEAGAESVIRTVWRMGRALVVVCDTVVTQPEAQVDYHWHGDADAYWGEEGGAVCLTLENTTRTLWVQSGQQALGLAQQHRLRGSRGQCTLKVVQPPGTVHHWWVFTFAHKAPALVAAGTNARTGNQQLSLADVLPKILHPPALEVTLQRDELQVLVRHADDLLAPAADRMWELALSVNGTTVHQQQGSGRLWWLPVPAVGADDAVVITARRLNEHGDEAHVLSHALPPESLQTIRNVPLRVYASFTTGQVTGCCLLTPGALKGEVAYAFYLLVDGQKAQVRWYEASHTHTFTLAPTELGKTVQIRGFVAEVAAPDNKLSATSQPFAQKV